MIIVSSLGRAGSGGGEGAKMAEETPEYAGAVFGRNGKAALPDRWRFLAGYDITILTYFS